MNEAFNTLLGLKPENMIGKSFIKLLALDETDIKTRLLTPFTAKMLRRFNCGLKEAKMMNLRFL